MAAGLHSPSRFGANPWPITFFHALGWTTGSGCGCGCVHKKGIFVWCVYACVLMHVFLRVSELCVDDGSHSFFGMCKKCVFDAGFGLVEFPYDTV
jgi:hypothetical protein